MNKLLLASVLLTSSVLMPSVLMPSVAADYVIDTNGAHASINFQASHLGFSVLSGRFNDFSGSFTYDKDNIAASKVNVIIDTASVDTNHAKRDKHVRSDDFLDASKYAQATFVSHKVTDVGNGKLTIAGALTLHGVVQPLVINAVRIGEGKDPWGGYRAGFSGTASITMAEFGFKKDYGKVDLILHIEGIRQ
jgi:polyisoprenoid-binding protein YceI